jgi:hypothetical protein
MTKLDEDDYPEIGQRRHGKVLVCHGDDTPDQFANWLDPLVKKFTRLLLIAEEHGVVIDPPDGSMPIGSVIDFCQMLGIEFESAMWTGFLTSGIYQLGWMRPGTARSASTAGRKFLCEIEESTLAAVKAAVMLELAGIQRIDEFLDRTSDDKDRLREQIAHLTSALETKTVEAAGLTEKVKDFSSSDSRQIDKSCVRMVAALLGGDCCKLVAGPLVLWDDGQIYVISSWGGQAIPQGSSPAVLLEALQKSGRTVVQVQDSTVIGGWMSGPRYRRGPAHISGWLNVWSSRESKPRSFSVVPVEFSERVQEIHEFWAASR